MLLLTYREFFLLLFPTRDLTVILSGNEDLYEPHSIFLLTLDAG